MAGRSGKDRRWAMREPFERLAGILERSCGAGPIYYLPNAGNWGDALIYAGTRSFFRDIGLEVREVSGRWAHRLRARFDRGTLIYGGGGAWGGPWRAGALFLERHAKLYRHVIVLPSTFAAPAAIPNATFFSRDESGSLANVPAAHFCHDMAFYLDSPPDLEGRGVGRLFRVDAERSGHFEVPADNHDLSAGGTHRSPIEPFYEAVGRFGAVHTDRLHVAIAACQLGRELHLYPGSYFKNEAVFRSSIEPFFPRAHFHATQAPPAAPRSDPRREPSVRCG